MQNQRVLIVGTTSDYIDILRHKYPPKSLLFLTSPSIRENAAEERPELSEEIIFDLDIARGNLENLINSIQKHLQVYNISLIGIACFDCESMPLAADIARAFNLQYPSIEAVMACRDKSITRKLWHADRVPSPEYQRVSSAAQAVDFFRSQNLACVLKPVDSSGSERVFKCCTAKECESAYNIICKPQNSPDIIIETYSQGTEYSCDFIVDQTREWSINDSRIEKLYGATDIIPIRFARKIPAPVDFFGTTMAYQIVDFLSGNLSGNLSENVSIKDILPILSKAAKSLGITRSICMVDFIIKNRSDDINISNSADNFNSQENRDAAYNNLSLLEMAPRPGGDCLPWLIQHSMGIDIFKLTVDFACNTKPLFNKTTLFNIDTYNKSCNLVGLRIHADRSGTLKSIRTSKAALDSRVKEIFLKHKSGYKIVMPPQNYDSWNLGHIIFKPFENISCKSQCIELLSMLKVEII